MMNILLINHYAGSAYYGMEYRPYYLSREWVRLGHKVTIVASSISHVRSKRPVHSGAVTEEMIDGIRYLWLNTIPYNGNGIKRAINIFSFVYQLYRQNNIILNGSQFDLVIASSTYPLDIFPASSVFGVKGILVYEVHDLWPLSLIELGGMSRYHPFIQLLQIAENHAYRRADKVVSMLPKTLEHMCSHGMASEKFIYVPNGIDIEEWTSPRIPLSEPHAGIIKRLKASGNFLVGYAGAHGVANALDTLINAAEEVRSEPITFVLVGQGPEKERLQTLVKQKQLGNVFFLPPVTRESIPSLLDLMDVLYIGLKSEPLFRFGVSPNKLIDYMMAGKPVIYAIRAGNDPIAECGCGLSITPEDPLSIVQAVRDLGALTIKEREKMGERGRTYALQNHDYHILAKKFLQEVAV